MVHVILIYLAFYFVGGQGYKEILGIQGLLLKNVIRSMTLTTNFDRENIHGLDIRTMKVRWHHTKDHHLLLLVLMG